MILGIAWYEERDYPRILDIMEDAESLFGAYDEWKKAAEFGERREQAAGHTVIRAVIKPEQFLAWCAARGAKVDSHARTAFANEQAARHAGVRPERLFHGRIGRG